VNCYSKVVGHWKLIICAILAVIQASLNKSIPIISKSNGGKLWLSVTALDIFPFFYASLCQATIILISNRTSMHFQLSNSSRNQTSVG